MQRWKNYKLTAFIESAPVVNNNLAWSRHLRDVKSQIFNHGDLVSIRSDAMSNIKLKFKTGFFGFSGPDALMNFIHRLAFEGFCLSPEPQRGLGKGGGVVLGIALDIK